MQVPDGTDWVEYMLNVPQDADKRELGVMNHISLGVVSVEEADEELKGGGKFDRRSKDWTRRKVAIKFIRSGFNAR